MRNRSAYNHLAYLLCQVMQMRLLRFLELIKGHRRRKRESEILSLSYTVQLPITSPDSTLIPLSWGLACSIPGTVLGLSLRIQQVWSLAYGIKIWIKKALPHERSTRQHIGLGRMWWDPQSLLICINTVMICVYLNTGRFCFVPLEETIFHTNVLSLSANASFSRKGRHWMYPPSQYRYERKTELALCEIC